MNQRLMQEAFPELKIQIEQAAEFIQQEELIIAEALYRDLLEKNENCPVALYGLSELAEKISDQQLREELLRRAIEQIKEIEVDNKKEIIACWEQQLMNK